MVWIKPPRKMMNRLDELKGIIARLKVEHGIDQSQILEMLETDRNMIPVSLYTNRDLGIMELTIRYMKDTLNYSYAEIGLLLNRDQRNIWVLYNRSLTKVRGRLVPAYSEVMVPFSIFQDREMGTLLAVVTYLKDQGLRFADIARLLARDPKMVCAVYHQGHRK